MLRAALNGSCVYQTGIRRLMASRSLYKWNMKTLAHPDNRYKSHCELYTRRELLKTEMCLKAVDDEIRFGPILAQLFPGLRVISLVRNGHSLCEGHLRRGSDVDAFAKIYLSVANSFKDLSAHGVPVRMIKFEDMIDDPFATAAEMLRFLKIEPSSLDRIRLKSKRVMRSDGEHELKFGEEDRKAWFDRQDILTVLDNEVNNAQRARLTSDQVRRFDSIAHEAMEFFGYD